MNLLNKQYLACWQKQNISKQHASLPPWCIHDILNVSRAACSAPLSLLLQSGKKKELKCFPVCGNNDIVLPLHTHTLSYLAEEPITAHLFLIIHGKWKSGNIFFGKEALPHLRRLCRWANYYMFLRVYTIHAILNPGVNVQSIFPAIKMKCAFCFEDIYFHLLFPDPQSCTKFNFRVNNGIIAVNKTPYRKNPL